MPSVPTGNYATYYDAPRRSYLTTTAFNGSFFSHVITVDPVTKARSGSLQAVPGASAGNCPANRVLYENGKKLFPDAALGVYTYMVGVFDSQTFLAGYIDPNEAIFTPMNQDKPVYLGVGTTPATSSSGTNDKAAPVYTAGTVTADGNISTGGDVTAADAVTATRIVVQNPVTQAGGADRTLDCSQGSLFVLTISNSTNFNLLASNVTTGQIVTVIFNNTGAFTPTISFTTNIRDNGSGLTLTSGRQATVTYVGFADSYLLETSRVAANSTS